jgi:hypothetical protein
MSIAVRNERFILTAEVLSERILSVFADEGKKFVLSGGNS